MKGFCVASTKYYIFIWRLSFTSLWTEWIKERRKVAARGVGEERHERERSVRK